MRKFYRDEENPFDYTNDASPAPSINVTEYRDEVKEPEPNIETSGDIIRNIDEASRRMDTAETGTVKVGKDENTGGINRAEDSTDIVFWAGALQENRDTAPFRVDAAGNVVATTVSGFVMGPIASDNLRTSADTERTHSNSATWTKKKEILAIMPGTYRVKFDIKHVASAGLVGYARIYKNGVAVGTSRQSTTAYVTHSEDLVFSSGDLIQLYLSSNYSGSGGIDVYCKNFRLYFDLSALPSTTYNGVVQTD